MTLENGLLKIFDFKGHGYIAFMNNATRNLELYDENFSLLLSKPITYEYVSSLVVADGLVAVTSGYLSYHNREATIYSVEKLEQINPSTLPVKRYHGETKDSSFSIIGVSFADTIVERYPVDFSQFTNTVPKKFSYNATKIGNNLYAAVDLFSQDQEFYEPPVSVDLFKFDLQGNIVDRTVVSEGGEYRADSALIVKDKVLFPLDQFVEYDLSELTKTKVIDYLYRYPEKGILIPDLYYYETDEGTIFADFDGNEKYRIQSLGIISGKSAKYFAARMGHDYTLYRTQTGEKVLVDKELALTVHDDLVIAHKGEFSNPAASGDVIRLYGEKTIDSGKDLYEKNKMWTITFSGDVDSSTVTADTVYVVDQNNEKVLGITYKTVDRKVEVYAPVAGYASGETYRLHISPGVKSMKETPLKQAATKEFTIK